MLLWGDRGAIFPKKRVLGKPVRDLYDNTRPGNQHFRQGGGGQSWPVQISHFRGTRISRRSRTVFPDSCFYGEIGVRSLQRSANRGNLSAICAIIRGLEIGISPRGGGWPVLGRSRFLIFGAPEDRADRGQFFLILASMGRSGRDLSKEARAGEICPRSAR